MSAIIPNITYVKTMQELQETTLSKNHPTDCSICRSTYGTADGDPAAAGEELLIAATKCDHIFCKLCLDKALVENHTCPICRTALRDEAPIDEPLLLQRVVIADLFSHLFESTVMNVPRNPFLMTFPIVLHRAQISQPNEDGMEYINGMQDLTRIILLSRLLGALIPEAPDFFEDEDSTSVNLLEPSIRRRRQRDAESDETPAENTPRVRRRTDNAPSRTSLRHLPRNQSDLHTSLMPRPYNLRSRPLDAPPQATEVLDIERIRSPSPNRNSDDD